MKDIVTKYEEKVKEMAATRERRKAELAALVEKKSAEIEEVSLLIDDAMSEDNLQKVEELTIRKAGLEMYLKTLKERVPQTITAAQRAEFERQGSEIYHAMAEELKEASEKDKAQALEYLHKAFELSKTGAEQTDKANAVLAFWILHFSSIDNASSVSIDSKIKKIHENIKSII